MFGCVFAVASTSFRGLPCKCRCCQPTVVSTPQRTAHSLPRGSVDEHVDANVSCALFEKLRGRKALPVDSPHGCTTVNSLPVTYRFCNGCVADGHAFAPPLAAVLRLSRPARLVCSIGQFRKRTRASVAARVHNARAAMLALPSLCDTA